MKNDLPNYTAVICFHVTTVYQLKKANYYRIMISKTKVSKLVRFRDCSFLEKSPPSLESNNHLE